jgi:hypothetical protein
MNKPLAVLHPGEQFVGGVADRDRLRHPDGPTADAVLRIRPPGTSLGERREVATNLVAGAFVVDGRLVAGGADAPPVRVIEGGTAC